MDFGQKWIDVALNKCLENESLTRFLIFIKSHYTDSRIDEYDIDDMLNNDAVAYGTFFIKSLEITMYIYNDKYQVKSRVGIDYIGYWNKFYDCILDKSFPMSKRNYIDFENEVCHLIGDNKKAKQYYSRHGTIRRYNKLNKGYGSGRIMKNHKYKYI